MTEAASWHVAPVEIIVKNLLKCIAIIGLLWWALVCLVIGMIAGDIVAESIGLGLLYSAYCFAALWVAK